MAMPAAVESAYEIIDLWEEVQRLRMENAHLKEFRQKYFDEVQNSINHSGAMIGSILGALVDPNSRISKLHALEAAQEAK